MSLQRALLAFGVTMALFGSAADASAQYYDRQRLERQRIHPSAARSVMQTRPVVPSRPVMPARPAAATTTTVRPAAPNADFPRAAGAAARPAAVAVRPAAVAVRPPVETPAKAAPPPPPPLTEEQLAAKAAVDEILAREPALAAAAKERPDPRLVKAAKARHDAHEQKIAGLKVKEEAEAVRRKDREDKNKTRHEARSNDAGRTDIKNAGQKNTPVPQLKNQAVLPKAAKPEPEASRTAVATMTPRPPLRMPAP